MLRPKIGLDWDDVTAPFNSIAIEMANEKYKIEPPLRLEDITSWEIRDGHQLSKNFTVMKSCTRSSLCRKKIKKRCAS